MQAVQEVEVGFRDASCTGDGGWVQRCKLYRRWKLGLEMQAVQEVEVGFRDASCTGGGGWV